MERNTILLPPPVLNDFDVVTGATKLGCGSARDRNPIGSEPLQAHSTVSGLSEHADQVCARVNLATHRDTPSVACRNRFSSRVIASLASSRHAT
jgi:hypothetical protein